MQRLDYFVVQLLFVAVMLLGQAVALPSWQCRVCQDAAQTWHDQFRCAGEFLDWGDNLSADIRGCQGPRFDCNKLAGEIKTVCLNTFKDFAMDDKKRRMIWDNQMLHGDAYLTCVALGKCKPDPAPGTVLTDCHQNFNDLSCGKNPACANYTLNCNEDCYVCVWLVRDFPLFQEICKPKGAALPQSVPLPTDEMALIEMDSQNLDSSNSLMSHLTSRRATGARFRAREATTDRKMRSTRLGNALQAALSARQRFLATRSEIQGREAALATARGGGTGDADAPKAQLQTGNTLTQTCFVMWNEIKMSMKARFFISWKRYVGVMMDVLDRLQGNMWDADIACKCLGRCELNRFEDLALIESCRYEESDQRAMELVFKGESMITKVRNAPGGENAGMASESTDN